MKSLGKIAVCLAGGLVLSAGAGAQDVASSGNPYTPIVVRNVFGLNPPQAVDPNATQIEPPLKITLNGIMSILGQSQALFKVAPKAGQPGAKEESYVLSEGQQQDEIEVTRIDERGGIVTFNNHGIVQEIPLVATPALNLPAAGGVPTAPGGIPTRFGGPRPGVRPGGAGGGPALNSIPTRTGNSTPQAQKTLPAEDQMLLIAAQHLKAQQEGDPTAAIFPPTEIDNEAGITPNSASPVSPKR